MYNLWAISLVFEGSLYIGVTLTLSFSLFFCPRLIGIIFNFLVLEGLFVLPFPPSPPTPSSSTSSQSLIYLKLILVPDVTNRSNLIIFLIATLFL